jgi:chemotaxis protein CheZ
MAVQRKRFRIEEIGLEGMMMPEGIDAALMMPNHNEIMAELRAIRAQMATPHGTTAPATDAAIAATETMASTEAMQATLEAYRAQIEQCEKLKVELDLIHEAINRTKREIAVLHGKSFSGDEMIKVTGELGAVVGGTEEATQQILEAAEAIDEAASALSKATPDQQARLGQDIQERVISIFEACNFQDLTGQRINKVMTTMKFIEHHINVMMDIWGGVDVIKAHAPPIVDERVGDARLLNGPKALGEDGHASQNDIDALFG